MDDRSAPPNLLTAAGSYLVLCPLEVDSAGNVVPAKGALLTAYEPFEFYDTPLPEESVAHVLGPGRSGEVGYEFRLHTLFASLSPEKPDELLRFMCKFGRLYYSTRPGPPPPMGLTPWYRGRREHRYLSADPEPMSNFLAELRLFRWVTEVSDLYSKGNTAALGKQLNDGMAMAQASEGPLWVCVRAIMSQNCIDPADGPLLDAEEFLQSAEDLLRNIFLEQLAEVSPRLAFFPQTEDPTYEPIKKPRSPGLSWGLRSLVGAMYLMLLLDRTKGASVRKCANERCGTFFRATRADQRYCTPGCQQRAKARRYWEAHPEKRP